VAANDLEEFKRLTHNQLTEGHINDFLHYFFYAQLEFKIYLLYIDDLYDFNHVKPTDNKNLKRLGLFKRHLVVKIHLYVLWNKSWTDESFYL